jgi:hypothetical protein
VTDAISHGHASAFGQPVTKMSGIVTSEAARLMSTIARNGSSFTLSMAFQPACSAAAASTARKMVTEMTRPRCPPRLIHARRQAGSGVAAGSRAVMRGGHSYC